MKTMRRLIALLFSVVTLAGCSMDHATDRATEAPRHVGPTTALEYSLYLPDDAPYEFTGEIAAGETVFLDETICTNTTRIKVKNKGDAAITCDLYYPDDLTYSIQTFTLKPGKSKEFSGLTSRFTYAIGFQSDEDGSLEIRITG